MAVVVLSRVVVVLVWCVNVRVIRELCVFLPAPWEISGFNNSRSVALKKIPSMFDFPEFRFRREIFLFLQLREKEEEVQIFRSGSAGTWTRERTDLTVKIIPPTVKHVIIRHSQRVPAV